MPDRRIFPEGSRPERPLPSAPPRGDRRPFAPVEEEQ